MKIWRLGFFLIESEFQILVSFTQGSPRTAHSYMSSGGLLLHSHPPQPLAPARPQPAPAARTGHRGRPQLGTEARRWAGAGACPLQSPGRLGGEAHHVPSEHPCLPGEVCNVPSEMEHPHPLRGAAAVSQALGDVPASLLRRSAHRCSPPGAGGGPSATATGAASPRPAAPLAPPGCRDPSVPAGRPAWSSPARADGAAAAGSGRGTRRSEGPPAPAGLGVGPRARPEL